MVDDKQVKPGNLDSFAKFVDELADDWNDPKRPAVKMAKSNEEGSGQGALPEYPKFGEFSTASTLADAYETKRGGMAGSGDEIYTNLRGLAEGARKIAEKYRGVEALNGASSAEISKLLTKHLPKSDEEQPQNPQDPGQSQA